jgi:large subunit ribosomal protein L17
MTDMQGIINAQKSVLKVNPPAYCTPPPLALGAAGNLYRIVAYKHSAQISVKYIMRHGVRSNNLGHGKDYRKTLFRSLAESFVTHGKLCTFLPRAKIMRSVLEKMITAAKADRPRTDIIRSLLKYRLSKPNIAKLIDDIAPRYKGRPGGYVRVIKNGYNGAANPLAVISLV